MSHTEQERNRIFQEFDRALTDAMIMANRMGMSQTEVMEYGVRKAGDHIMSTFGISLEVATSIAREGLQNQAR